MCLKIIFALSHFLKEICCIANNVNFWTMISAIGTVIGAVGTVITLFVSISIAKKNSEQIDKQNDKILYDNEINRKANFQSVLSFNKCEIITMNDSLQIWKAHSEFTNVLYEKNQSNKNNELGYGIKIIYYLKNLTNIYPQKACVKSVSMWDNKYASKEQSKENEPLSFNFYKEDDEFKDVVTDNDNNTCIEIICSLSKAQLLKLEEYEKKDTFFNIIVKLEIINTFNIVSKLELIGKVNIVKKDDISSGALGGNKIKISFENINSYLKIVDVREAKNGQ